MSSDEHEILNFLKEAKDFVSPREVGRRVGGKKRYFKNPTWAKPLLMGLVNAGHADVNDIGHFRYKPEEGGTRQPGTPTAKKRICVSPEIARIFEVRGKTFLLDDVSEESQ